MSRLIVALCCVIVAAACGRNGAPPPPTVPPATNETITGRERIGWDQRAGDAAELNTIGYVLYVDGARTPLTDVRCAATATASGFACSTGLPPLSAGAHALQLASFVNDGGVLESERSSTLQVTVVTAVTTRTAAISAGPVTAASFAVAGNPVRSEGVIDGLDQPADLAFTPDGRLFVAQRDGRVRIAQFDHHRARLLPEQALSLAEIAGVPSRLVALTPDPDFERNQFVYVVCASIDRRSGDSMFTLARLRESSNTLGDPIVLLDGVRASAAPAAALRFGRDHKVYVAFDDGGDAASVDDAASFNAKTLRLNTDGTTPSDQARMSPVYAAGDRSPRGFIWDRRSGRPVAAGPESTAPYAGRLFTMFAASAIVATTDGQLAARWQDGRTVAIAPDHIAGVVAVTISPDGAIYFATSTAIGRLVPDRP